MGNTENDLNEEIDQSKKQKFLKKGRDPDLREVPCKKDTLSLFNFKKEEFSIKYLNGKHLSQDMYLKLLLGEKRIVKKLPTRKEIIEPKVCPCCFKEYEKENKEGK